MNNPFEAQTAPQPPGTGRTHSPEQVLGRTAVEETLFEQSVTPEHLTPSFLAACRCSPDVNSLAQELEYLWDDSGAPGKSYEVYLGKISRNPVIKSKVSGKFFALPWSVIIRLASENGIDK